MNKNGTTANLEERFDSIKENVKNLVDRGRGRVSEVKDQAVSRGNDFLTRVTDLIRANPLKAVGIAFGVGYISMRLFRR